MIAVKHLLTSPIPSATTARGNKVRKKSEPEVQAP